jgi:hypothetical protein
MDQHLAFARELGRAFVAELTPLLKNSQVVVRVNAARMLSVVGMLGYEGAAELALTILEDAKGSDPGAMFYALQTLTHLFAFPADPAVAELTVFDVAPDAEQKQKNRALKKRCVQFLCDYIVRSRDVAGLSEEQVAGIRYVRREAVRALGQVRSHRLREGSPPSVVARPGLVLLKVANRDGLVPEPDLKERVEAVNGFCRLFPVLRVEVDRNVQCDYAAHALGTAILDIVTRKSTDPVGPTSLPWRVAGEEFDHYLKLWQQHVSDMNLPGQEAAKALYGRAKADLLDALKAGNATNQPNTASFREWLQANPPKATSLYSDEPATTLKVIGG